MDTAVPIPKAVLVGIALPHTSPDDLEQSLTELGRLVKTLGYTVVQSLSQARPNLAGETVVGEGKLKELARYTGGTGLVKKRVFAKKTKAAMKLAPGDEPVAEHEPEAEQASVVVFDCDLSPSQMINLQSATGAEILDRTAVIVQIFSRHARTREARLQVEVARLKYLSPRLRETGLGEDRIGKEGETSIELDRRRIRNRVAELKLELETVQKEQAETRQARVDQQCVALVGYTNAGKSSLMRVLTGSQVLVEDKLFATLDTTVRAMSPPTVPPILVSDTVGFINKLPHHLVASFRSTLEEARSSRLLLFVADAADPSFRAQLKVTAEVLSSIGVADIPARTVLNKTDKLDGAAIEALRREFPDAFLMSTRNPADVAALRQVLIDFFEADMGDTEVFVPYHAQKAIGELRTQVRVLGEEHTDQGTTVRIRAHRTEVARLKAKLGLP